MNKLEALDVGAKVLSAIVALPEDVDIINVHFNWYESKPVIHVDDMDFAADGVERWRARSHCYKETENGVVLLRVEFGEDEDGTDT